MKALANGALCSVTIRKSSRNLRRMRFYRGMLKAACEVLAQQVPGLQPDDLHAILKKRLGLGDTVTLPSGDTYFRPASTSFARMDEPTFAAYVTRVDGVLSRWIGCPPGGVIDEARAMMGDEKGA